MRFLFGTRAGQSLEWLFITGLVLIVAVLLLGGMAAGATPPPV